MNRTMLASALSLLTVAACGPAAPAPMTPANTPPTAPLAPATPDERTQHPAPPGQPGEQAAHKPPPPPSRRPQHPREAGPPPVETRAMPLPRPVESKLPNALAVTVIERRTLRLVDVRVILPAGNAADPVDRPGLARMTAALLASGTKSRTRAQLAEQIEFAGGELAVDTSGDATVLATRVLASQLDLALGTLADLVRNPTFTAAAVEEERKRALAELDVTDEHAAVLAGRAVERLAFHPGPYGRLPTRASIAAITRDDVVKFHDGRYRPDGAIVLVVGDVAAKDAAARVAKAFGSWRSPSGKLAPLFAEGGAAGAGGPVIHLAPVMPSAEVRLVIGWRGPAPRDAAATALLLLSHVVEATIEHPPVSAYVENHREASLFAVATRTARERTVDGLKALLAAIEGLRNGTIADAAIADARRHVEGSFLLTLDSDEGLARLAEIARDDGLPADTWDGFRGRVAQVSKDALRDAAKAALLPERAQIVVVGDAELEPALKAVLPVELLDESGAPASQHP